MRETDDRLPMKNQNLLMYVVSLSGKLSDEVLAVASSRESMLRQLWSYFCVGESK